MIKQLVEQTVSNLGTLEKLPSMLKKEIKQLEQEQLDILHSIEFSNFNACDGYKLSKRLQEIRKTRREYKDMDELVHRVAPLIGRHKQFKTSLETAVRDMGNIEHTQTVKTYSNRVIGKDDELAKLRSVNKTGIRFKQNSHVDRLEELFNKIK